MLLVVLQVRGIFYLNKWHYPKAGNVPTCNVVLSAMGELGKKVRPELRIVLISQVLVKSLRLH